MANYLYPLAPGLGNTNSYIGGAAPWLSGSNVTGSAANNGEVKFAFPRVCRSFTVVNTTTPPILVYFHSRGTEPNVINNHHYFTLNNQGDSITYNVRCTAVYVSNKNNTGTGSVEISAELTPISDRELANELTGAGITD